MSLYITQITAGIAAQSPLIKVLLLLDGISAMTAMT